jgi:hypothetical protein
MSWMIATVVLGAVALLFIHLYRMSLRENRALANYALLILLDDGVYAVQRKGLADLVRSTDARSAVELGPKVYLSATNLALRLSGNSAAVAGLLWKLKGSAATTKPY